MIPPEVPRNDVSRSFHTLEHHHLRILSRTIPRPHSSSISFRISRTSWQRQYQPPAFPTLLASQTVALPALNQMKPHFVCRAEPHLLEPWSLFVLGSNGSEISAWECSRARSPCQTVPETQPLTFHRQLQSWPYWLPCRSFPARGRHDPFWVLPTSPRAASVAGCAQKGHVGIRSTSTTFSFSYGPRPPYTRLCDPQDR